MDISQNYKRLKQLKYSVLVETIITFTDQNDRPLEIEDNVDLTWLINKQK